MTFLVIVSAAFDPYLNKLTVIAIHLFYFIFREHKQID